MEDLKERLERFGSITPRRVKPKETRQGSPTPRPKRDLTPGGGVERIVSPMKLRKKKISQRRISKESEDETSNQPNPHQFFSSFVDTMPLFQSSPVDIKEANNVLKKMSLIQGILECEDLGVLVCPPHIPYGLQWTPLDSLHSQVYPNY